MANVVVIGAGIIGVTTALSILEKDPSVQVTVVADEFSPNTTSDGAAGYLMPYVMANTPLDLQRKWFGTTMKALKTLLDSELAPQLGLFRTNVVTVYDKVVEEPYWKDLVYSYHRMPEKELADFPAQPARFGYTFSTIISEGSLLIPWLMNKVRDLGGSFVKRHIESLTEKALKVQAMISLNSFQRELSDYDVIVNCTGLGARELVGDTMVKPVRGQILKIKAPWIKHTCMYNSEEDDKQERSIYIIPQIDSVIIGGTKQLNNFNTKSTLEDTVNIISGTSRIIPSIKNATVLQNWAGLRPGRFSVRLESETIKCTDKHGQQKMLNVVHNYGHGGAGLTVSFGCADDCSDLVLTTLTNKLKAKL